MKAIKLFAGLAAFALLAAGCGGGAKTPTVAQLGSSASSSGSTNTGSSSSSTGASHSGSTSPDGEAVAYSACVRAHGVPNFPEPKVSTNGNEVKVAIAINPSISSNPHFNAAQQACRKLLPGGGPGNAPALTPAQQDQYLKAAACIRSHGVPKFPDPTFSGGGVHIAHHNLNESSPTFKTAVHDCESLIPGGVHGGSGHSQEAAPAPGK
jgi:hypothetical protein